MNDFAASFIRTYVPYIVSAFVGFFAARNITFDPQTTAGLTAFLTGVFYAVYYSVLRLLEKYVSPKFGWFLGFAKQPKYDEGNN